MNRGHILLGTGWKMNKTAREAADYAQRLLKVLDDTRGLETKAVELRKQWQVRDVIGPVGAFQMNYVLERERGPFEGVLAGRVAGPRVGHARVLRSLPWEQCCYLCHVSPRSIGWIA